MHLLVDCAEGIPDRLRNEELLYRFLEEMPAVIGMHKISLPQVYDTDNGLCGFILIAESHIALHTYPDKGELLADVYSCLAFDLTPVLARLMLDFGVKKLHPRVLERGLEYLSKQA